MTVKHHALLYFLCDGCSTPAHFIFRLLPLQEALTEKPDLIYAELVIFPFLWRDTTRWLSRQHTCLPCTPVTAEPSAARPTNYYKGRNGFCLKSFNFNCFFPFKQKQGGEKRNQTKSFVAPKSFPSISDQHTCCYNYDWTAWLRHRGMLNQHTGTHQNICELPKWNWHHGSGLCHTSQKGFITHIKQVNSWVPCLERGGEDKCYAADWYCTWLFHVASSQHTSLCKLRS